MMTASVSVLIATRDRPADLEHTLEHLFCCRDLICELIVIDDGSSALVEPLVRQHWPDAMFVRHRESAGQCQRRSEGFRLATGKYILQLDDDSAPVGRDTIARAVEILESRPETGILTFYIYNGSELPEHLDLPKDPRYTISFVGCGALIRKQAVLQTNGYIPFFGNEWEEEELSLQIMKAGWGLYFDPSLVIHHRVSPRNRRSERTWMRGFRNKLWALVMHYPLRRLPIEAGWVIALAGWDALRMLRVRYFVTGVWQFAAGLSKAMALRKPMPDIILRRYDCLRFKQILTQEEFTTPPVCTGLDIWKWFTGSWMNRARQRSFWDRRPGDTGASPTVAFAHERSDSAPGNK